MNILEPSKSESKQKKRKVDNIDEGEARPLCPRRCEPLSEHWNFCPICGTSLKQSKECKIIEHPNYHLNSLQNFNNQINPLAPASDNQAVALILTNFDKYVRLNESTKTDVSSPESSSSLISISSSLSNNTSQSTSSSDFCTYRCNISFHTPFFFSYCSLF
jgi:hypothetical protein